MATVAPVPGAIARLALLVAGAHREVVEEIADDARRYAPVDTGALRESIQVEHDAPGRSRIAAYADYAAEVEYGTRPHVIEPDTKEALAWPGMVGGPYARVNHPGTEAQPFLRPAVYKRRVGR